MSSFGKSEVILLNDAQSRLGAYRRRISTGWCLLPGSNPVSVMSWRSCREVDIKCLENCVATYIHTLSSSPCHRLNFGKKEQLYIFTKTHPHVRSLCSLQRPFFFWQEMTIHTAGERGRKCKSYQGICLWESTKNLWKTVGDWVRGVCVLFKETNGCPAMHWQLDWPGCWDSWCVDNSEAVFSMRLRYN